MTICAFTVSDNAVFTRMTAYNQYNNVPRTQNSFNSSTTNTKDSELTTSTSKYDHLFDDIVYPSDIEGYDYFELLDREITPFMNWLETMFDFDNPSDEEFVDKNYNKLMLKAINENIISDVFNKPPTRFKQTTHEQITTDALAILLADGKTAAHSLFNDKREKLLYGSKQPDKDEMFTGHHYYVYGTTLKDGYYENRLGDYSVSARTRFEEHYSTAINAYKNGDIDTAIEELGRALHYLQDTACTPHSAGLVANNFKPAHKNYENWIEIAYNSIDSAYGASSASTLYGTVLYLENLGSILNQVAEFSYQYKNIIVNYSSTTTDVNYSYYVQVASNCIPYSQKMTAVIMYKFYADINNLYVKSSYIKDGSIYYIKNVGTGKYIDVESWSTENNAVTHPYDFHGDTNQQFRAEMQEDGSFKFTPMHVQYKKLHISGIGAIYERLNITGIGHKFRPVYYKDGYYKLIPDYYTEEDNEIGKKYYKYPIKQDNNEIKVMRFEIWDPTDLNYYWKFEEAPIISCGEVETFIGKFESKKVIIKVATSGNYDIETIGSVDTCFDNLSYRIGTGNTTLTTLISTSSDDDGDGSNPKYSNVNLVAGRTYILTLRGYASNAGSTIVKVSGNNAPTERIVEEAIRSSPYTITDSGRFNNSYDTINFSTIFGESVLSLRQKGYTKVSMTLSFYAHEVDDGYQHFWIYDGNTSSSNILYGGVQFEHNHANQDSTPRKYYFANIEFDLDDIINNTVYIRYGASGNLSDTWCNYDVSTRIKIY